MISKPLVAMATALLLVACESDRMAAAPPAPVPAAQGPNNYMVFFDWDRSNISQQAAATIKQAAGSHKSMASAPVSVVGHADKSGPNNYNMALSLRRANAVKDGLVREGVNQQAIQVAGRGEEQPLVQTADGVREPQNRRVEIAIGGAPAGIFSDPKSYCKALTDKWRQFRTSQVDTVEAVAISKCEAGDYAAGIPVLENSLITARIALPAPGYRWPGRPIS